MGGLRRYMPITWITMWIGTLALTGLPGFAGFFSKDAIIEAAHDSHRWGSGYAYWCVLLGVFVTAFYSFRLLYLTFHGKERFVVDHDHGHGHSAHHAPDPTLHADAHAAATAAAHAGSAETHHEPDAGAHDDHDHHLEPGHLAHAPTESPWVVTLPLILLAIPSIAIGWATVGSILHGDYFGAAIRTAAAEGEGGEHFAGAMHAALEGLGQWPFILALLGFASATYIYLFNPSLADKAQNAFKPLWKLLDRKYWVDELYQTLFAKGSLVLGRGLWKGGDVGVIDNVLIDGTSASVGRIAAAVRWVQSGYLYTYAFAMILGLVALLGGLFLVVHQ